MRWLTKRILEENRDAKTEAGVASGNQVARAKVAIPLLAPMEDQARDRVAVGVAGRTGRAAMVMEGFGRDAERIEKTVRSVISDLSDLANGLPEDLLGPVARAAKEINGMGRDLWERLGLPRELFRR